MKWLKKAVQLIKEKATAMYQRSRYRLSMMHLDSARADANEQPDNVVSKHVYAGIALQHWNMYMKKGAKYETADFR